MNKYELRITKPDDMSVRLCITWVCGETLNMAIEHANYWEKNGDKIGSDWTIDKILSVIPIDYYPYTYEDAFRFAVENKIKVIHSILQKDRVADFDKLDLIKVITNETPSDYISLDTACRDLLVSIINENYCDDIFELVMDFTNPGEDLSEEDAARIMGDMEANGYTLPIGLTPKDFLEVYHECESEEEE